MADVTSDVVVIGGGPAGLTAAIALAAAGVDTAVVARPQSGPDHRTSALWSGSVTALETLGVWPRCREHAAELRVIRLIDDTARLVRAPEVRFDAEEIGLRAFGWNIANANLLTALAARARELATLTLIEDEAESVVIGEDMVTVRLRNKGVIDARLAVGADGRNSLCRTAAGIGTDSSAYPQTALTCNLAHSRPHEGISTEFHTQRGPFTLVPLPGDRSSLVFVTDPTEAPCLFALDDAELAAEIERRSHSILGRITLAPGRGIFPLRVETARQFASHRVTLVGEAAHVLPPIGAQGLNLGLRDAATVAELVAQAHRDGGDTGARELTARYDRMRRADVASRRFAVDLLNRSLLSDFLPLQGARGLGPYLVDRIGPLRRALMREGVMPVASQPRLMRGEAL
jgi:2-octaprenyl-6-methoxyphenol hydroxylase